MRAVIQRVASASVHVEGVDIAAIDEGLLVLLAVSHDDVKETAQKMASKICALRILADEDGKMNLSVKDKAAQVLVVSQFTLNADTSRGNRPSFVAAADPVAAEKLIDEVVRAIASEGVETATGRFGAHMRVSLQNDGPVTIILDL